jgi:hypothetical protein
MFPAFAFSDLLKLAEQGVASKKTAKKTRDSQE